MNYIKQLTAFFQRTSEDHGLNATHVSLYMALFQFWNLNRFHNPISIARDEAMQISKIGSKSTYHKCMQELHRKKYIIYEPSCNPLKGSIVRMIDFELVDQILCFYKCVFHLKYKLTLPSIYNLFQIALFELSTKNLPKNQRHYLEIV